MELTIKNVPENDLVITEILANAEATIRNYHQAIIFEVTEAKVSQLNDVVNSFRTANVRAKSVADSPTNPTI